VVALGSLVAFLLAGCSGFDSLRSVKYPANLRYPPRHDLLVEKSPKAEPRRLPAPGEMDEAIRRAIQADPEAKGLNPDKLSKQDAKELHQALEVVFGTPRRPRIAPRDTEEKSEAREDYEAWLGKWMRDLGFKRPDELSLVIAPDGEDESELLARGSILYRRHCMHCHGLAGDGRGPTGPWVNPHPRDYRRGVFKFVSTGLALRDRKPRRDDLKRTLRQGIDGTSMPSFGLLDPHELEYLASYVIHLSLRGEVEFDTLSRLLTDPEKNTLDRLRDSDEPSITQHVYSTAARLLIRWTESNSDKPIVAPPYTEPGDDKQRLASISRGHQLFITAGCVGCHTDFGRQVPYKYDVWGTLVRPANLTVSTYRGGRRPIDIYWRIKGGIPGANMAPPELKDEDYWHLVNFVRALPYPKMLPEDVQKSIYGLSPPQRKQARLMK
jgi:mono/diheme cytochrome c family protein